MSTHPRLCWVRYGNPITDAELDAALGRYRVAILQPWETAAASKLKAADPSMTVLAYKCLSSVRDYEPGPIYSSGISTSEAESLGTFATTNNGEPIEWFGYPGHFQQQVWNASYREQWITNVTEEIADGPFDGIMADNDVFDDYYNHNISPEVLRAALDQFIDELGPALAQHNKILVPNIAEARREKGRWARHSKYGGGFEECWIGWGTEPNERLWLKNIRAQNIQLRAPGLSIARIPGKDDPDENKQYLSAALAAAWVFAPTADVAVTATAHDGYHASPWIEEANLDLGQPLEAFINRGNGVFSRRLTHGYARVDLHNMTGRIEVT